MPPKIKFDREKIIKIAFDYVRENGWEGLSARYIASQLNSSTGPIYTHFSSMAELEDEVVKNALKFYFQSLETPITGDKWLDSGIALIRFAIEEKHLFRCMNDEKHSVVQRKHSRPIWQKLSDELADHPSFKGLSPETALRVRLARWWLVHGLASLFNNGWFGENDAIHIESVVKATSLGLLEGLREHGFPVPRTDEARASDDNEN